MAYQLSPGVNVSEIDLSTIIPAVGSTQAGFVGTFNWGPADVIMNISDEIGLASTFGTPDANTYESFFTAANFLAYGNSLRLLRSVGATSNNAVSANSGIQIKNRDVYESTYLNVKSNANTYGMFAAKYPGALGNSLKVAVCATAAGFTSAYNYASQYNSAPGTSTYVSGVSGSNDEMHITVVDEDGVITGTANTILEKFGYISKASDAKNDDGSSNYYVNVLNDQSKYVYAMNSGDNASWGNTAPNTTFASAASTYTSSLANGTDVSPSDANLQTGYDFFKNSDSVDISLILTGSSSNVVSKYVVDNIAETRKDCVVFISPKSTDVVNKSGSEVTNISATRNGFNASSYAFMDNNWKYQFDKYNNVYRWVPLNGDIAGLCVRTDFERDPWFSPAGYNRGQIKNVTKLAWNPTKSNRDDLYKIGVNSVVSFQGDGTILYGDKTMLTKPSAFDRINVRRLFIVLEKAIARASKYSLFEFNDEFTRAQFISLVQPYLRDVQGRRGIFDFRVVCDTSNNTPEVIDRNEFVGDIYIKPARSINFIQLNFVAVRTGVNFETIVGRF
ncbi:COG3497 Phage tail sheath protein FI [uncultured Caudovirales phage]|uniref:COG3497 Phage tail sheath protein FI n=1 Tax=uncultured Caudovirales phage TaxID=2100421 RepID=A0A6J5RAD9_9CAUD|nr:COG3497 Phage tail sheath protein FI [uncultured Caudovirales phage]CAB4176067.1 COG3497 Phage tail sheath protein FI [uncultured Caudovirales phage]CAB4181493.1 COG3497 Phage tail sheath protein FI [uncultured Caudovirales phage]CAB4189595.1 COG3497 Phage tail sheath protein FI [uncultured Caudovirales phage]CAB4211248.1 COG3497 Phage tail sheath protein FI [uncultured Caudovirales phage]